MTKCKQALGGMGHVFRFTFAQFLKSRANNISLAILLLVALLSVPLGTLFAGGTITLGSDSYDGRVSIVNESGLPLDFSSAAALDPYFAKTTFRLTEDNVEDEVFAHIYLDGAGLCAIDLSLPEEADFPASAEAQLVTLLKTLLHAAQAEALGVTEEQQAVLDAALNVSVGSVADFLSQGSAPEEESSWESAYFLQLFYAVAVMMVSMLSVSYIIRAVVEEKSSKLVELLMVSIKPLALIVGKILAAMCYVLLIFALLIAGFVVSYAVTGLFLDTGALGGMLEGFGLSLSKLNLSFGTIVIVIVSMLLAYLTFAIVAGVSGTGCSTMEEMGDATGGVTMLIMAGYFISIVVGVAESETVTAICCLLPVFSVFCAPAQYILGTIGFGTLALSWALQAVVIVLLALFCARVYHALLIHRGKRVKWREMLSLAGFGKKEVG